MRAAKRLRAGLVPVVLVGLALGALGAAPGAGADDADAAKARCEHKAKKEGLAAGEKRDAYVADCVAKSKDPMHDAASKKRKKPMKEKIEGG